MSTIEPSGAAGASAAPEAVGARLTASPNPRYERRWIVERFFAWMQWQRRPWFAGNTTRPIFSVSYSLQPYASCSGNFEIGSSQALLW